MASSLSDLANNLSEGIQTIRCKYGHGEKIVELVELKINIVTVILNTQT